MIVTSRNNSDRWALYEFLRAHGVELPKSEDFQAIGRVSPHTKDLVGVVGYNGFTGRTCMMHMAGNGNWVNRTLLRVAFDYPFNQAGCIQVFGVVNSGNARALKLNKHLGFSVLTTVEGGWSESEDLIVLSLAKKDCRWLEKGHDSRKAA